MEKEKKNRKKHKKQFCARNFDAPRLHKECLECDKTENCLFYAFLKREISLFKEYK